MEKLYSFEYKFLDSPNHREGDWTPKVKAYKTMVRAEGAALKWKNDMANEGCFVSCRVVELVPSGTGRKASVLFEV